MKQTEGTVLKSQACVYHYLRHVAYLQPKCRVLPSYLNQRNHFLESPDNVGEMGQAALI